MKKQTYLIIAAFLIGMLSSWLLLRQCESSGKAPLCTVTVRDTVTARDTVTIRQPVPHYITAVRTDTVPLAVADTVCNDTAAVIVPIEQKVYEDSAYRAYVSGFRASLDSIFVYSDKQYIYETKTQYKPPKRFTWGLQVGVGTLYNGTLHFGAYAGVGLNIRLGK